MYVADGGWLSTWGWIDVGWRRLAGQVFARLRRNGDNICLGLRVALGGGRCRCRGVRPGRRLVTARAPRSASRALWLPSWPPAAPLAGDWRLRKGWDWGGQYSRAPMAWVRTNPQRRHRAHRGLPPQPQTDRFARSCRCWRPQGPNGCGRGRHWPRRALRKRTRKAPAAPPPPPPPRAYGEGRCPPPCGPDTGQ